jgi:hypothetical protein
MLIYAAPRPRVETRHKRWVRGCGSARKVLMGGGSRARRTWLARRRCQTAAQIPGAEGAAAPARGATSPGSTRLPAARARRHPYHAATRTRTGWRAGTRTSSAVRSRSGSRRFWRGSSRPDLRGEASCLKVSFVGGLGRSRAGLRPGIMVLRSKHLALPGGAACMGR